METFAPDFPILPAGDSPSLSFSEMLNQTSSNFEYNVNSVSVSPTPCSEYRFGHIRISDKKRSDFCIL